MLCSWVTGSLLHSPRGLLLGTEWLSEQQCCVDNRIKAIMITLIAVFFIPYSSTYRAGQQTKKGKQK